MEDLETKTTNEGTVETNEVNAETFVTNQGQDYKSLYEKLQTDYQKVKISFDKASSELAETKRRFKANLSEEEQRKQELLEKEQKYAEIEKENLRYKYKSSLDKILNDEDDCEKVLNSLVSNDIFGALKTLQEYWEKEKEKIAKSVKAELMAINPNPSPLSKSKMTKEQIMKVEDYFERQKLIQENIDLFI